MERYGVLSYKNNHMGATTIVTPTVHQHARNPMENWHTPFKIFSALVVLLMVSAMIYGGVMALMYWSGIGV